MPAWIVAFRQLLYLFNDVEKRGRGLGSISIVRWGGGIGRILVGWHLLGSIFVLCTNSLISDIAMDIQGVPKVRSSNSMHYNF